MSKFLKYAKALRLGEVLLMTGFFMIGAVFAIKNPDHESIIKLLITGASCFFLIVSIYAYNAFAGKQHDAENSRLFNLTHLKDIQFLWGAIICLLISISFGLFLNYQFIIALIAVSFIWFIYSMPVLGLKLIPFGGTVLHFVAQIIHFNMVFCVFAPLGTLSLLISLFFSSCFAGGHVNHEIIDYEADKEQNLKTGAVYIGIKNAVWLSYSLFFLGMIILTVLYFLSMINLFQFIIFIFGFLAQTLAFLLLKQKMISNGNIRILYRTIYRFIFFSEGIILIFFKLFFTLFY